MSPGPQIRACLLNPYSILVLQWGYTRPSNELMKGKGAVVGSGRNMKAAVGGACGSGRACLLIRGSLCLSSLDIGLALSLTCCPRPSSSQPVSSPQDTVPSHNKYSRQMNFIFGKVIKLLLWKHFN